VITNPTKQRALRGHNPTRPSARAANNAEHQALLAWRLTPRDRWIIRMVHEHRVFTAHQITALAFPSFRSGRMRLRELFLWGVLDRFQPFVSIGTAPMHYVLAPAGAAVLAAEDGLDVKDLGYRHERAFGIAHSLRLAHTVGVNDWFTALVDRARHAPVDENASLTAWWSEARCAKHFGDLVKPDAYGRWTAHGRSIEFFLEFDFGTETLSKLAGKLTGYAALASATAINTPLLIWLPTSKREASARHALHKAWCSLHVPEAVPVATSTAELIDPSDQHPSPAEPIWLPLTSRGAAPARRALHQLLDAWPHISPPVTDEEVIAEDTRPTSMPAPNPMPPPASGGSSTSSSFR